jgi:hypothetical protein
MFLNGYPLLTKRHACRSQTRSQFRARLDFIIAYRSLRLLLVKSVVVLMSLSDEYCLR